MKGISVITKKITAKMMSKLLRIFYKDYEKEHGHGSRHIGGFPILTTAAEVYLKRMPELAETEGGAVRYRFLDILIELEKAEMMRSEGGVRYFLTDRGYDEASKSLWCRFIEYWNNNPGLNTVIAILSMLISGASMWVAILALNKPGP